ncbi:matrixin family metalloprotease [bacterium]|nr:matrixin family metalloprotease [bacterium]
MKSLCLILGLLGPLSGQAREPHPSVLPISVLEHSNWVFEVPVSPSLVPPPPDQFDILRVSGRVCHIAPARLPWRIYTGNPDYNRTVDKAIETWNQTGLDLGLGYLYARSDDPGASDLEIRWFDPQLPTDKVAATWWRARDDGRRVLGISLDGSFAVPEGNRAQILTHELGHVLGLGESYQPGDMMYFQMEHRRLNLDQVQLSLRDKLALRWLYQQRDFAPIWGKRD